MIGHNENVSGIDWTWKLAESNLGTPAHSRVRPGPTIKIFIVVGRVPPNSRVTLAGGRQNGLRSIVRFSFILSPGDRQRTSRFALNIWHEYARTGKDFALIWEEAELAAKRVLFLIFIYGKDSSTHFGSDPHEFAQSTDVFIYSVIPIFTYDRSWKQVVFGPSFGTLVVTQTIRTKRQ